MMRCGDNLRLGRTRESLEHYLQVLTVDREAEEEVQAAAKRHSAKPQQPIPSLPGPILQHASQITCAKDKSHIYIYFLHTIIGRVSLSDCHPFFGETNHVFH